MEDIAKRFQRLLWILQQLSNPGGTTSGRLADLYKVSQRTIQRDITDLKEASFDIHSKGRRHWIDGGQSLDIPEVLNLALGDRLLNSGQERACEAQTPNHKGNNQALLKLAAFVKGERRIESREWPQAAALGGPSANEPWFPELMTAIVQTRTVRFFYQALGRVAGGAPETNGGIREFRRFDPWTLLYQAPGWYLHGYDHSLGEPQIFRLTRIKNFELSDQTFSVPAQHRADAAVFHRWDLMEGRKRKVLCRVSPELSAWLEENPVHPSQTIEDGVLEFQVRDLERVAAWILSLVGIEVLQPNDLRVRVRQRAHDIAERHRRRAVIPAMPSPS